jgi:phospholipid/cholesterol/gamma-HCH transport system substrate-binding protein
MTPKQRNLLVGGTVLIAFVVFAWMFMRFGVKTATLFAPPETEVRMDAPRVDGLSEGSAVTYQGVGVGRILKLDRNPSGTGITITALLETQPPVPINVNAEIVMTNLIGGGTSIELNLRKDPKTNQDQSPQFAPAGVPYPLIHAAYVGLKINLFPSEYGDVATQISRAASAIADASEQARELDLVKHLDEAVQNINMQVTRAGQVFQSIQNMIGDPSIQFDMRQTIVNAKAASENLARVSADLPRLSQQASNLLTQGSQTLIHAQDRVDELSKQISDGLAKTSALLDSVHAIAEKIDNGQGTAGLLVNDPKLYQGLVDASRQLNLNLADLQRLLEQWEQEGLSLKMK